MKGSNVLFLKDITKQDIEYLSKWKNNRSLSVGLRTEGLAIVDGSVLEFNLKLNANQFKLGIDEFQSLFLKNTGLQYTYTREFELSSPLIDNLASKPALQEFYNHICNLQNNLEYALPRINILNIKIKLLLCFL